MVNSVEMYDAQLTRSNQAAFCWSPWRICVTNLNPWICMRMLLVKPVTTLLHIRLLLRQHQFHICTSKEQSLFTSCPSRWSGLDWIQCPFSLYLQPTLPLTPHVHRHTHQNLLNWCSRHKWEKRWWLRKLGRKMNWRNRWKDNEQRDKKQKAAYLLSLCQRHQGCESWPVGCWILRPLCYAEIWLAVIVAVWPPGKIHVPW